jgi:hypothetical protein
VLALGVRDDRIAVALNDEDGTANGVVRNTDIESGMQVEV